MPPPLPAPRARPDGLRRARLAVALDFAKVVSRRHFDGIIPCNGFRMVGIGTNFRAAEAPSQMCGNVIHQIALAA
jgi:hypothetical protein